MSDLRLRSDKRRREKAAIGHEGRRGDEEDEEMERCGGRRRRLPLCNYQMLSWRNGCRVLPVRQTRSYRIRFEG
uniref:Uncharacterized protein n=1 Tax=Knipowitschia caucasica TaxID=637954 RepID=A0AAV2JA61_KNICA